MLKTGGKGVGVCGSIGNHREFERGGSEGDGLCGWRLIHGEEKVGQQWRVDFDIYLRLR